MKKLFVNFLLLCGTVIVSMLTFWAGQSIYFQIRIEAMVNQRKVRTLEVDQGVAIASALSNDEVASAVYEKILLASIGGPFDNGPHANP